MRRSPFAFVLPFGLLFTVSLGCATVKTLPADVTIATDAPTARIRTDDSLAYAKCSNISAPAAAVWDLLVDVENWTTWNSTILRSSGTAALGNTVTLVAKIAPDREFQLQVTEFTSNERMVWEDGMPLGMFSGVRTYSVGEGDEGATKFCMNEVYSGGMLGQIEGSLPDMRPAFELFASELKTTAEGAAPAAPTPEPTTDTAADATSNATPEVPSEETPTPTPTETDAPAADAVATPE